MKHQFVFVVDDERLQAQATLLAASLHQHCSAGAVVTAFAPESRIASLNPLLLGVFKATGTELRSFAVRPDMWRKPYPHGNKIIACAMAEASAAPEIRRITFLDTDMVCTADLVAALPTDDKVAVVPEGKPTWGKEISDWQRAYDFFDLPLPAERVHLVRGRKREFVPYFNAGMVSFPAGPKGKSGKGFAEAWAETASSFDRCNIANKRPWLDQITLPLTLYRAGFGWTALDESYNFSLSNRSSQEIPAGTKILHYHRGRYLKDFTATCDQAVLAVQALLKQDEAAAYRQFIDGFLGQEAPPSDETGDASG